MSQLGEGLLEASCTGGGAASSTYSSQHVARDRMRAHFMGWENRCIRYFPHGCGVFVLIPWADKCTFWESDEAGSRHMREPQQNCKWLIKFTSFTGDAVNKTGAVQVWARL